jgi:transaldolase
MTSTHIELAIVERLKSLSADFGQSPWIDQLRRADLRNGKLSALVQRGVRGVTSNPTIFQKAFLDSTEYDAQFAELFGRKKTAVDVFWAIAFEDVREACEILDSLYRTSKGMDGYVSLEVSPFLARDGPTSVSAAREIRAQVAKANLMVKIPATAQCLESIETMTAEGANINVTLIFSLTRYDEVIEAYLSGLESMAAAGAKDLSLVASVASFFISRVDKEVDRRLDLIGTDEAEALKGRSAIAQGVLAYQLAMRRFSGPRWEKLAALGAKMQRPLWASTSTKNPAYPDTMYVDSLIGPNTVNTLPEATLEAFADHGTLARTIDTDRAVTDAHDVMADLAKVDVDMHDVAQVLEVEGIGAFEKSFGEMISAITTLSASTRN